MPGSRLEGDRPQAHPSQVVYLIKISDKLHGEKRFRKIHQEVVI